MRSTAILVCCLLVPGFCYAGPFTPGVPQSSITVSTSATYTGLPSASDSKSAATGSLSSAAEIPATQPGTFHAWGRANASQQFTVTDSLISVQGDTAAKTLGPPHLIGSANADSDTTFVLDFSVNSLSDVIFSYDLLGSINTIPNSVSRINVELTLTGPGVNQHFVANPTYALNMIASDLYQKHLAGTLPLSLAPGNYSLSITQDLNAQGYFFSTESDGNVSSSISASIQAVPEPSGVLPALVGLSLVGLGKRARTVHHA